MKLIFRTFFLGIFLIPFYFFRSGMPQFSHFLILLSFLFLIFKDGKYRRIETTFIEYEFLLIFILWALIIGFIFFSKYGDFKTIVSPFYFLFNFIVMYMTARLYVFNRQKFINYVFNVLFYSVILLFLIDFFNLESLFHSGKSFYRKVLTFNNPNQLGYWTLSTATIFFILRTQIARSKTNNLKFFISIVMLIYLSMISLSKASSIAILILLILNSLKSYKFVVLVIIAGYLFYLPLVNSEQDNFVKRFDKRLNDVGDANDDNLEGRGYLRIFKYPNYIFFGAGEGATEVRFNTPMEMHSSFGTILFSYGIIGLFIFSLFLFYVFKYNPSKFLTILTPILLYSVAHMGLRFTFFWFAIGLFIIVFKMDKYYKIKVEKWYLKNYEQ